MLPRAERIAILEKRIENLKKGSGSYSDQHHRDKAIREAEDALEGALEEIAFADYRKSSWPYSELLN